MASVEVRRAVPADLDEIVQIDANAFGGMNLPYECFDKWLNIFPNAFLVAVNRGSKVVAYSMAIRLDERNLKGNWYLDTGFGTCETHVPNGRILYGVTLASYGKGAGSELCLMERRLVEETSDLNKIYLHSRLPGFRAWMAQSNEDCGVQDMLDKYLREGHDSTLHFYNQQGLSTVRGVIGYLPDDSESAGCAALTVWQKPKLLSKR